MSTTPTNIWIIPLEVIPTRYTAEWFSQIPKMLREEAQARGQAVNVLTFNDRLKSQLDEIQLTADDSPDNEAGVVNIINVEGHIITSGTSGAAFINWAVTNIWKSSQGESIAQAFNSGLVKPGDTFYFTDSWNPVIIQTRYMADLLGIPIRIIGQWHAGWHDPHDYLGRTLDKSWVSRFEAALFYAIDKNLFTTKYYVELFKDRLNGVLDLRSHVPELVSYHDSMYSVPSPTGGARVVRVGYPNGYLQDVLKPFKYTKKERIVLFPHRLAPEKQLEIFKDLEQTCALVPELSDVKFLVCQERQLTKSQYHLMLAKSRVVFSCALQETYGIAQTEAVFAGCLPLSPDRLSYSEMYIPQFKYPSEWTINFQSYLKNRHRLIDEYLTPMLSDNAWNSEEYAAELELQEQLLVRDYIGDIGISQLVLEQWLPKLNKDNT